MLDYFVDQASVDQTVEYLEAIRKRIFAEAKLGMAEAMDGLGAAAISGAASAGIQSRSGKLDEGFEWHRVVEYRDAIVGEIEPRREMKLDGRTFEGFIATALDEGYVVPASKATGTEKVFMFVTPDGEGRYTLGHKGFKVAPHPFLRAAVEGYEPTLIDIIQERVAAATEAA